MSINSKGVTQQMELQKIIEKISQDVYKKVSENSTVSGVNDYTYSNAGNLNIASMLEHTLLRPDATADQVKKFCQEARENRFGVVIVSPYFVPLVVELLKGSGISTGTVIGFPHGAASTKAKLAETKEAIQNGAAELDVVINNVAMKSGDYEAVRKDMEEIVSFSKGKVKVKAIIESCLFTEEEKIKACEIVKAAGVDYIKVSTALGTGKATTDEIRFFKKLVGPHIGVKADGGIKDLSIALEMINAGASRIGTSSSVAIVKGISIGASRSNEKSNVTAKDIAKMIDHSLLNPTMTKQNIIDGCKIAKEYDVASVCVKPSEVALAKIELAGTDVLVTTVVGFPHGSSKTEVKAFEALEAIKDGAVELDMVLNIGRLISRDFNYVEKDIKAVVDASHAKGVIVKVILENCYLTDELKEIACRICEKAGADFVKTSTGYGSGGATIEDLKLMRKVTGPKVRVKAAGGVRTLDNALAVRSVGTVRFGATATKAIVDEAYKREKEGTLKLTEGGELKGGY